MEQQHQQQEQRSSRPESRGSSGGSSGSTASLHRPTTPPPPVPTATPGRTTPERPSSYPSMNDAPLAEGMKRSSVVLMIGQDLNEDNVKEGIMNPGFEDEASEDKPGSPVSTNDHNSHSNGVNGTFLNTNPSDVKMNSLEREKAKEMTEAVNLELVNMSPYNGTDSTNGIPVKKEADEADIGDGYNDPYDEYFVPVNEHRKYMRGEKLYVTKDKRRSQSWKRCLCWGIGCVILAIVILIAVLAGTGVILSQEEAIINENSVSGRQFGNVQTAYEENQTNKPPDSSSLTPIPTVPQLPDKPPTTDSSPYYLPRAIEGELVIDDKDFIPAYADPNSQEYKQLIASLEKEIKESLFDMSTRLYGSSNINLKVIGLSPGSIVVKYRIGWEYKEGIHNPPPPIDVPTVGERLSSGQLPGYHISFGSVRSKNILDMCQINNGGCSHYCKFDYMDLMDFICTCPQGYELDDSRKNCMEKLHVVEDPHIHDSQDEIHSHPEPTTDHPIISSSKDDILSYYPGGGGSTSSSTVEPEPEPSSNSRDHDHDHGTAKPEPPSDHHAHADHDYNLHVTAEPEPVGDHLGHKEDHDHDFHVTAEPEPPSDHYGQADFDHDHHVTAEPEPPSDHLGQKESLDHDHPVTAEPEPPSDHLDHKGDVTAEPEPASDNEHHANYGHDLPHVTTEPEPSSDHQAHADHEHVAAEPEPSSDRDSHVDHEQSTAEPEPEPPSDDHNLHHKEYPQLDHDHHASGEPEPEPQSNQEDKQSNHVNHNEDDGNSTVVLGTYSSSHHDMQKKHPNDSETGHETARISEMNNDTYYVANEKINSEPNSNKSKTNFDLAHELYPHDHTSTPRPHSSADNQYYENNIAEPQLINHSQNVSSNVLFGDHNSEPNSTAEPNTATESIIENHMHISKSNEVHPHISSEHFGNEPDSTAEPEPQSDNEYEHIKNDEKYIHSTFHQTNGSENNTEQEETDLKQFHRHETDQFGLPLTHHDLEPSTTPEPSPEGNEQRFPENFVKSVYSMEPETTAEPEVKITHTTKKTEEQESTAEPVNDIEFIPTIRPLHILENQNKLDLENTTSLENVTIHKFQLNLTSSDDKSSNTSTEKEKLNQSEGFNSVTEEMTTEMYTTIHQFILEKKPRIEVEVNPLISAQPDGSIVPSNESGPLVLGAKHSSNESSEFGLTTSTSDNSKQEITTPHIYSDVFGTSVDEPGFISYNISSSNQSNFVATINSDQDEHSHTVINDLSQFSSIQQNKSEMSSHETVPNNLVQIDNSSSAGNILIKDGSLVNQTNSVNKIISETTTENTVNAQISDSSISNNSQVLVEENNQTSEARHFPNEVNLHLNSVHQDLTLHNQTVYSGDHNEHMHLTGDVPIVSKVESHLNTSENNERKLVEGIGTQTETNSSVANVGYSEIVAFPATIITPEEITTQSQEDMLTTVMSQYLEQNVNNFTHGTSDDQHLLQISGISVLHVTTSPSVFKVGNYSEEASKSEPEDVITVTEIVQMKMPNETMHDADSVNMREDILHMEGIVKEMNDSYNNNSFTSSTMEPQHTEENNIETDSSETPLKIGMQYLNGTANATSDQINSTEPVSTNFNFDKPNNVPVDRTHVNDIKVNSGENDQEQAIPSVKPLLINQPSTSDSLPEITESFTSTSNNDIKTSDAVEQPILASPETSSRNNVTEVNRVESQSKAVDDTFHKDSPIIYDLKTSTIKSEYSNDIQNSAPSGEGSVIPQFPQNNPDLSNQNEVSNLTLINVDFPVTTSAHSVTFKNDTEDNIKHEHSISKEEMKKTFGNGKKSKIAFYDEDDKEYKNAIEKKLESSKKSEKNLIEDKASNIDKLDFNDDNVRFPDDKVYNTTSSLNSDVSDQFKANISNEKSVSKLSEESINVVDDEALNEKVEWKENNASLSAMNSTLLNNQTIDESQIQVQSHEETIVPSVAPLAAGLEPAINDQEHTNATNFASVNQANDVFSAATSTEATREIIASSEKTNNTSNLNESINTVHDISSITNEEPPVNKTMESSISANPNVLNDTTNGYLVISDVLARNDSSENITLPESLSNTLFPNSQVVGANQSDTVELNHVTAVGDVLVPTTSRSDPSLSQSNISYTFLPEQLSKCTAGQFQCVNTTANDGAYCVSLSAKCDSVNDCLDGSDEIGCIEQGCPNNFQCTSGQCLKRHLVCNGIIDCNDGSDELNCEKWQCKYDEYQCPSGRCIPVLWQCDGKPDCDNHTDEYNCQSSCKNDEYFCPERWCIPQTWQCNGVPECANGEDEKLCDCSLDQFKCNTGGCVDKSFVCDGVEHCPDFSDEWDCMRLYNNSAKLQVRSSDNEWYPVCSDNWNDVWSDKVCQNLGYSKASFTEHTPIDQQANSNRSLYLLKNSPITKGGSSRITVALEFASNSSACQMQSMVEITCQEFSCGAHSQSNILLSRMVGGSRNGQWPSVALLYHTQQKVRCTASIISPKWLIASYNCLHLRDKNLKPGDWVAFGGGSMFDQSNNETQIREVQAIIPYPQVKYNQILYTNDVALVELADPLEFNRFVGAICLPQKAIQPRELCVTAGWGSSVPGQISFTQYLEYLPVPMIDLNECNSTKHYAGFITENEMCTGYSTDKTPCYNDEGAPLMCVNDEEVWELHGVLSYHSNCGRGNHPSIYSSISAVRSWVEKTVGSRFISKSPFKVRR